jgi:hypothetical protein
LFIVSQSFLTRLELRAKRANTGGEKSLYTLAQKETPQRLQALRGFGVGRYALCHAGSVAAA